MTLIQRFASLRTLMGLIVAAVSAGCAAPEATVRDIDPQAGTILEKMCDTLDGAVAMHLRVRATMERPVETGQMAEFHRTSDITVARPDRLYAETQSDDGNWIVWYRGRSLTLLDREENTFATEAVPSGIGDMLDYMADTHDLVMPMADLLAGNTYESLVADVESGAYVGLHKVGENDCHHLLFRQENIDWQIWIDAGEQSLPRKLVITYKEAPDQPEYVAIMDDWNLSPTISEQTFTFTPPAGAQGIAMSDLVASN